MDEKNLMITKINFEAIFGFKLSIRGLIKMKSKLQSMIQKT
jgi:hypothetical protein